VPLDPAVRSAGDEGRPTVVSAPESVAGVALLELTEVIRSALDALGGR